jgi:hypothetical protein
VEVSSSAVKNSESRIVGRMGSFVNITKRKKLEQESEKLIQKLQNVPDSSILKSIQQGLNFGS